jgi:uncharacterized membrane protein YkoI
MNINKLTLPALAVTLILIAGGTAAFAKSGADLANAKVTLVQAVTTAEQHAGGRATGAELETEKGKALYEVEVVAANKAVYDVTVDAGTGKVLASKIDKADSADEADEKDDD